MVNENLEDRQVENRRADEDRELTDAGAQDEKLEHNSLLEEIESGLAAAVQFNANAGNPDTPGTIGSSGAGTPNNT
jgi:hypothetical protein